MERELAPAYRASIEARGYTDPEIIGDGGMAIVVRATHITLGVRAIKILMHNANSVQARFEREARSMAEFERVEGIVQVYDFWRDDQTGTMFMAMEYMDGGSLQTRIERREPMALTDALEIIQRVLTTLTMVHARGLTHRDIKPANVLFRSGYTMPYLCDFGIVATPERDGRLTRDGSTMGTPAYMAPEQNIDAGSADHRADIHAVGVMLQCLVAGEPLVYHGQTFRDNPANVKAMNGLHPAIRAIVDKATQIAPADRYQSASEMRDALASAKSAVQIALGATIVAETVRYDEAGVEVIVAGSDDEDSDKQPLVAETGPKVDHLTDEIVVIPAKRPRPWGLYGMILALMVLVGAVIIWARGCNSEVAEIKTSVAVAPTAEIAPPPIVHPPPAFAPVAVAPPREVEALPPVTKARPPKVESAKVAEPLRTTARFTGSATRVKLVSGMSETILDASAKDVPSGTYSVQTEFAEGGGWVSSGHITLAEGVAITVTCSDWVCSW